MMNFRRMISCIDAHTMGEPFRVAVSGVMEGPGLFEMLALLGRDRVLARLRKAATL